jgi:hypothetical protein
MNELIKNIVDEQFDKIHLKFDNLDKKINILNINILAIDSKINKMQQDIKNIQNSNNSNNSNNSDNSDNSDNLINLANLAKYNAT